MEHDNCLCDDFWRWWSREQWRLGNYDDVEADVHARRVDPTWVPSPSPMACDPDDRPRTRKSYNEKIYLVTATVTPSTYATDATYVRNDHGQAVIDALWNEWQAGKQLNFVMTHGDADGNTIRLLVRYGSKGGNANDVARKVERAVERHGRSVSGDVTVGPPPTFTAG